MPKYLNFIKHLQYFLLFVFIPCILKIWEGLRHDTNKLSLDKQNVSTILQKSFLISVTSVILLLISAN